MPEKELRRSRCVHAFQVMIFVFCLSIVSITCNAPVVENKQPALKSPDEGMFNVPKNALLLTRFSSFAEFASLVRFKYEEGSSGWFGIKFRKQRAQLIFDQNGSLIATELKDGISEQDFWKARDGSFLSKVWLGIRCPFALWNRTDLRRIEYLGRKRPWMFEKGDAAFYDLAETMVFHISIPPRRTLSPADLSEKGYLNTFNHITAQAFMTSMFSEAMADFIADVHERQRLPELITGKFTPEQIADLHNGPTDNYIDMLNNEIGQDLGKWLKEKYSIDRNTYWTPTLLMDYLNDLQRYFSWAFEIGFGPFLATDEVVVQFCHKVNALNHAVPDLRSYYSM